MVAAVDVVGPEGGVDEPHVLNGDVRRVADVSQAWPLGVFVGALWVPLATNPELLPVRLAAAIDGATTSNSEAVDAVGIDQGSEVLARLSLDARFADLEVVDTLRTFQHAAFLNIEIRALTEEEASGEERAPWNDNDAPTLLCGTVDDGLNLACLDVGGALAHTIVGEHVLASEVGQLHLCSVSEPGGHRLAVGPQLLLRHFLLGGCHRAGHGQQEAEG